MFHELLYRITSIQYHPGIIGMPSRRPVLVNGTPKTGTTWMAQMLLSLPTYEGVGNFQGDLERYRTVRPGQVIHGHDRYSPELAAILTQQGIGVVIMLRDPRDQVVSHMYHIRRDVSNLWHKRLASMDIDQALMTVIEGAPGLDDVCGQYAISLSWLSSEVDVCCVRYEDLISDTISEFDKVLHHLGIEVSSGLATRIVQRNQFERITAGRYFVRKGRRPGEEDVNSHYRKGVVGDWRKHFGPAHIQRFQDVANDLLVRLGYEQEGQPWL